MLVWAKAHGQGVLGSDLAALLSERDVLRAPAGEPSGEGGILGLLNRIYLWQPDGSALINYVADADGLSDALTAAYDGSVIALPSIPIDLTTAITIPIGVSVIGLSHDGSILSFTTLSSATAITHSARATLEN